MRPARKGDGTGLSFPGYSEVRKGDGTVLWSAGPDIPDSGLLHDWDAQSLNANDQDPISTFPDFEGSNDATGNGTYQASGINGYPSVSLDGTNDDFTGNAPSVGSGNEYTVAVVFEFDTFDSSNFNTVFYTETGGYGGGNRDGQWNWVHGGEFSEQAGTTTTDPTILLGTYDGTTLVVEVNGTEIINTTGNFSAPSGDFYLGSQGGGLSRFMDGDIGQLRIHDEYYDGAQRDNYNSALADRWGITL